MHGFSAPEGVELLRVNENNGLIADDSCPTGDINAAFLDGTAPPGTCSRMGETHEGFGSRIFGLFKPADKDPKPEPQ
jgi:penicillin-binding protein 1B